MTLVHTILIETHGKQDYLFATGKRREAVGASCLVSSVAEWAAVALGSPTGRIANGDNAETVVMAGGQFIAFCRDVDHARSVVTKVTKRALREAPGLGVTGVVGGGFVWNSGDAPDRVKRAFAEMEHVRAEVAPPVARFPVLPVTALCPSSGLPAAGWVSFGGDKELRSEVSIAKLQAADEGLSSFSRAIQRNDLRRVLTRLDGDGNDSPERIAIVHADGNGLGMVVQQLGRLLTEPGTLTPDDDYASGYRDFSEQLDAASVAAFRDAVRAVAPGGNVLPLVLGGDDLTFVADAAIAPRLTVDYMRRLVANAASKPAVATPLAKLTGGDPRLGIAAGLVVVAPKYPFSAGYALAEGFTSQAKEAKRRYVDAAGQSIPCLSLAAHVHLDSNASTADQVRESMVTRNGARLTANPYVEAASDRVATDEAQAWLNQRRLDDLWTLAGIITTTDEEGRRVLPAAQLHEIRGRLRRSPAAAEQYLNRLCVADKRWFALQPLFVNGTARLLDALALATFIGGEN